MQIVTRKKSTDEDTPEVRLCREIDDLQMLSRSYRDDYLGSDFFGKAKRFFTLKDPAGPAPTFRPRVTLPELQMLMINEATDLSDSQPRVYISHQDERAKARETAFQKYWAQERVNNRLFEAALWAMNTGTGFMQIGATEAALTRRKKTRVWAKTRNPETVFPDPGCTSEENWSYVSWEDEMYCDQAVRFYDRARLIKSRGRMIQLSQQEAGGRFEMPPGPLRNTGSMWSGNKPEAYTDGKIVIRTTFLYDSTEDSAKEHGGSKMKGPTGQKRRYPNGRMIVDSEGIILFDDENPFPFGEFPLVRFSSMPALYNFWGVPPLRYSEGLQTLAGRMLTQVFENAVRLNNGVWLIPEDTGIDAGDFGGLPGEIRIVSGNGDPSRIQLKTPAAFPQHFLEYPQLLMDWQRKLQGFSPARSGEAGAGNISPTLFDSSIYQSQFLTRMRSRLMSESIQRLAEMMFYTMVSFMTDSRTFPAFNDKDIDEVKWEGIPDANLSDFLIELDPDSIQVVSMNALRSTSLMLRQQGALDTRTLLDINRVPNADEIADNMENEQKLAALAKLGKRGK